MDLGGTSGVTPEFAATAVARGDSFALRTDAFRNGFGVVQAVQLAGRPVPLRVAAARLVEPARERGGRTGDNITS